MTAIEVKIDADSELRRVLQRVVVDVYGSDEASAAQSHAFAVKEQRAGTARFPFTFVVRRGAEQQVKVVVRGFESPEDGAAASVEHKFVTSFSNGEERYLDVMLVGACRNLQQACTELDRTCVAAPGATAKGSCGALLEVETRAGRASASVHASDAATGGEVSCETSQVCVSSDYPCEDSSSYGFQCRGQFAQWPMPDATPGSKYAPSYTVDAEVVHDDVTGLAWQRVLPETYSGCTAQVREKGDTCSWRDAKAYCMELDLDGRSWRLPSKIELESLVLHGRKPALDVAAFPESEALFLAEFWSASSDVGTDGLAWNTEFIWGNTSSRDISKPGKVRCVSSVLSRSGTPKDRYVPDTEAGVVTDTATGLSWQDEVSAEVFEAQAAAAKYCEGLGHGFRLPSAKELLTTIDPTRFLPSIDPALPTVPKAWLLHTSSACSDADGSTMLVSTNAGMAISTAFDVKVQESNRLEGEPTPFERHAWCVR